MPKVNLNLLLRFKFMFKDFDQVFVFNSENGSNSFHFEAVFKKSEFQVVCLSR